MSNYPSNMEISIRRNDIQKNRSSRPSSSMTQELRLRVSVERRVYLKARFTTGAAKYAGLEVNEAKQLRELESENAKLKRLLADKLIEVEAMKEVVSKKW